MFTGRAGLHVERVGSVLLIPARLSSSLPVALSTSSVAQSNAELMHRKAVMQIRQSKLLISQKNCNSFVPQKDAQIRFSSCFVSCFWPSSSPNGCVSEGLSQDAGMGMGLLNSKHAMLSVWS